MVTVTRFAFDEFRELERQLTTPVDTENSNLRYVCALVAELTYHHVPSLEVDDRKRAKLLVPSLAHGKFLAHRVRTDLGAYLRGMDFMHVFVVVDRGVIAVGLHTGNRLFIGFRGSRFLFDWRTNLRAQMTPVYGATLLFLSVGTPLGYCAGRLHRGFAEEAIRVSIRIRQAVAELRLPVPEDVVLSGHSLGGSVAAIAESFLRGIGQRSSVVMFGAPRYCDVSYHQSPMTIVPTQIRRRGDVVPCIPSRRMGYADHPLEYDTQGKSFPTALRDPLGARFLWLASRFVSKLFEPHWVEGYRQELGRACGAKYWSESLTDLRRLVRADIG